MKRILFFLFTALLFIACNSATSPAEEPGADTTNVAETPAAPAVALPYTPVYESAWTDDVSDNDLLTVLNSYKHWETGDLTALKSTLADSVQFYSWSGMEYKGSNDGLLKIWTATRDSLSSVKIIVDAWRKMHGVTRNEDWISIWYTEVDVYKTGKVDSSYYQDNNMVKNGKIAMYTQHKQVLKKK
jgi:hypothetical protein